MSKDKLVKEKFALIFARLKFTCMRFSIYQNLNHLFIRGFIVANVNNNINFNAKLANFLTI